MNAKKKFAKFATCKKKLIFTVWVSFFWRQTQSFYTKYLHLSNYYTLCIYLGE